MDYERGLEQLKRYLRGTAWEQEFQIYEARLRENLHREQLYGENEQKRSDRAQIIDQLNRLAEQTHPSFNNLCLVEKTPPNYRPPKNPWAIIAIVGVLLAVIFASTTSYLLITRSTSASNGASATHNPTATTAPPLGATTVASTPKPTTGLSSKTTNYQFICNNNCSNKVGVVLNDIKIDSTSQTMTWDFTITNNATCGTISGQLSLEDSMDSNKLQANGGIFPKGINNLNSGQELQTNAIFSSIPKQGVKYLVALEVYCDITYHNSYQAVYFKY